MDTDLKVVYMTNTDRTDNEPNKIVSIDAGTIFAVLVSF